MATFTIKLNWVDFTVAQTTQILYDVYTNLIYEMDLSTIRSLFLRTGSNYYLNYVNNPIFATMDVARFYVENTTTTMQQSALEYAADDGTHTIGEVTNSAAWITAFRASMAAQLAILDTTGRGLDLVQGDVFLALASQYRILINRTLSTEQVMVGNGVFNPLNFIVGDTLYFDVTCTFPSGVADKIYRVNLLLTEPATSVPYPISVIASPVPPVLSDLTVYIGDLLTNGSTPSITVNGTGYTLGVNGVYNSVVSSMSNINFLTISNRYLIIYATFNFLVSGFTMHPINGQGGLIHSITGTSETTTLPLSDLFVEINSSISSASSLATERTTDNSVVLRNSVPFKLVDTRSNNSEIGYTNLGFERLQPYSSLTYVYLNCMSPTVNAVSGSSVLPCQYVDLAGVTSGEITVVSGTDTWTFEGTLAAIKTYFISNSPIRFEQNLMFIVETTMTVSVDGSALPVKNAFCLMARYVAMSHSPTHTIDNLANAPLVFVGSELPFENGATVTVENMQAAIANLGYSCFVTGNGFFKFLQIESPTVFTLSSLPNAGFYDARVAQLVPDHLQVKITYTYTGATPAFNLLQPITNTVYSEIGAQNEPITFSDAGFFTGNWTDGNEIYNGTIQPTANLFLTAVYGPFMGPYYFTSNLAPYTSSSTAVIQTTGNTIRVGIYRSPQYGLTEFPAGTWTATVYAGVDVETDTQLLFNVWINRPGLANMTLVGQSNHYDSGSVINPVTTGINQYTLTLLTAATPMLVTDHIQFRLFVLGSTSIVSLYFNNTDQNSNITFTPGTVYTITYWLISASGPTTNLSSTNYVDSYLENSSAVVSAQGSLLYNDASFLGWSTDSNATIAEYVHPDTILMTQNITLYIVWGPPPPS
jgi:hypothetical protein